MPLISFFCLLCTGFDDGTGLAIYFVQAYPKQKNGSNYKLLKKANYFERIGRKTSGSITFIVKDSGVARNNR